MPIIHPHPSQHPACRSRHRWVQNLLQTLIAGSCLLCGCSSAPSTPSSAPMEESADASSEDSPASNPPAASLPDLAPEEQSAETSSSSRPVSAFEPVEEEAVMVQEERDGLPLIHLEAEMKRIYDEVYLVPDPQDLLADHWWEDTTLASLPVYRAAQIQQPDLEGMEQTLRQWAERFSEGQSIEIRWNTVSEEQRSALEQKQAAGQPLQAADVTGMTMSADLQNIRLSINPYGTVEIVFVDPWIGAQLDFSGIADPAPADYLATAVAERLGLEPLSWWQSTGSLGMTLNADARSVKYPLYVYVTQEDPVDQLVSATLQPIQVVGSDSGSIYMIRLYHPDLADKVGDYPLRSLEEARSALEKGDSVSGSGIDYADALASGGSIEQVSLLYRGTAEMDADLIPWYRFLVRTPLLDQQDLYAFTTYYVPAIDPQWIQSS